MRDPRTYNGKRSRCRLRHRGRPDVRAGVAIAQEGRTTSGYLKQGRAGVSFNLIDFYHNFSCLLGVDSYGLTARQVGEIAAELRCGFETGALKPPAIEIVPFEKAVDAYSQMTAGLAKAKHVPDFRFGN